MYTLNINTCVISGVWLNCTPHRTCVMLPERIYIICGAHTHTHTSISFIVMHNIFDVNILCGINDVCYLPGSGSKFHRMASNGRGREAHRTGWWTRRWRNRWAPMRWAGSVAVVGGVIVHRLMSAHKTITHGLKFNTSILANEHRRMDTHCISVHCTCSARHHRCHSR